MERVASLITLKNAKWLWAIVLLSHLAIRLLASDVLEVDDAEQVYFSYRPLALGYQLDQPPLYTWGIHLLFLLTGPSLLSITLYKYSLIVATVALGFRISRRLFNDEKLQVYGATSLLLLPIFGYQMHVGFSHTILLALAIYMTLDALLSLKEKASSWNYLYLGLAMGIGVMSKYSYLAFLIPLMGSALTIQEFRRVLLSQPILLSIFLASLIVTPHLLWAIEERARMSGLMQKKLRFSSDASWQLHLKGLYKFFRSAAFFALPFLIAIPFAFPQIFRKKKPLDEQERLLRRFYGALLFFVLISAFFVAATRLPPRWFPPFMMTFPLFVLLRLRGNFIPLHSHRIMLFATLFCSLFFLGVHAESYLLKPLVREAGRPNWPITKNLSKLPNGWQNWQVCVPDSYLQAHVIVHSNPKVLYDTKEELDLNKPWIVIWPTSFENEKNNWEEINQERLGAHWPIRYATGDLTLN